MSFWSDAEPSRVGIWPRVHGHGKNIANQCRTDLMIDRGPNPLVPSAKRVMLGGHEGPMCDEAGDRPGQNLGASSSGNPTNGRAR